MIADEIESCGGLNVIVEAAVQMQAEVIVPDADAEGISTETATPSSRGCARMSYEEFDDATDEEIDERHHFEALDSQLSRLLGFEGPVVYV